MEKKILPIFQVPEGYAANGMAARFRKDCALRNLYAHPSNRSEIRQSNQFDIFNNNEQELERIFRCRIEYAYKTIAGHFPKGPFPYVVSDLLHQINRVYSENKILHKALSDAGLEFDLVISSDLKMNLFTLSQQGYLDDWELRNKPTPSKNLPQYTIVINAMYDHYVITLLKYSKPVIDQKPISIFAERNGKSAARLVLESVDKLLDMYSKDGDYSFDLSNSGKLTEGYLTFGKTSPRVGRIYEKSIGNHIEYSIYVYCEKDNVLEFFTVCDTCDLFFHDTKNPRKIIPVLNHIKCELGNIKWDITKAPSLVAVGMI